MFIEMDYKRGCFYSPFSYRSRRDSLRQAGWPDFHAGSLKMVHWTILLTLPFESYYVNEKGIWTCPYPFSIDGVGGIRTLVPRRANAFRVRPVMTASIRLQNARTFSGIFLPLSTNNTLPFSVFSVNQSAD